MLSQPLQPVRLYYQSFTLSFPAGCLSKGELLSALPGCSPGLARLAVGYAKDSEGQPFLQALLYFWTRHHATSLSVFAVNGIVPSVSRLGGQKAFVRDATALEDVTIIGTPFCFETALGSLDALRRVFCSKLIAGQSLEECLKAFPCFGYHYKRVSEAYVYWHRTVKGRQVPTPISPKAFRTLFSLSRMNSQL